MNTIKDNIVKIQQNVNKIQKICSSLLDTLDFIAPTSYVYKAKEIEQLSVDTYCESKKILPFKFIQNANIQPADVFTDYAEVLASSMNDGYLCIRIPHLPHKRLREDIVTNALYSAFERYLNNGNLIPQMRFHTINFTHVYPSSPNNQSPIDHDNYNVRGVVNVIVMYIGSSDSGLNSWQTHKTMLSDDILPGTYIEVRKREPDSVELTPEKIPTFFAKSTEGKY